MPTPLTVTQLFTNNAISLLAAPISQLSTSLTVLPGHGALFPQPSGTGDDYFLITLENQAASTREIIKVTNRTGDTLIFTLEDRGQEDTSVLAWPSGGGHDTIVDHRVTAETLLRATRLPEANNTFTASGVTTATVLDSIQAVMAEWDVRVVAAEDSTVTRAMKILATHNGSVASFTIYAVLNFGTITDLDVSVSLVGNELRLTVQSTLSVNVMAIRIASSN